MNKAAKTQRTAAVEVFNPEGKSPVVILCEHASHAIPERYNGLGLAENDRKSHAAWDPGALPVAQILSAALDAPLVASTVSRLVYDCNRPPEAPSAMPETSELIKVPGNRGLTQEQREERTETVYAPFCEAVAEAISTRTKPMAIVTMHSFTPFYFGKPRATEIGILHDTDTRLADLMLEAAPALPDRLVERNSPYGPEDGVTHSLVLHGVNNGLANVMIEIRNDLVRDSAEEAQMTEELLVLLRPALAHLAAAAPATEGADNA